MRVLVACEKSAAVRDAFLARGHDAWSCDMLPTDGRHGNHLVGDVRHALDGNFARFPDAMSIAGHQPLFRQWDMLIAFPPCTYLSVSGMHWTTRGLRDPALTEEALDLVREILAAPIAKIAMENPVGIISTRIRKPDQTIQPYHFGHDASKRTCLWLKGLPALQKTKIVAPRMVNGKPRWANQTDSGQNKLPPSERRAADRARTYQGIANAMADQWG